MIVEAFGVPEETALGDLRKYRRKYIPDLGRDPTASVYVVNETFVPRNVEEPDSEEWLQCYTEINRFLYGSKSASQSVARSTECVAQAVNLGKRHPNPLSPNIRPAPSGR